MTALEIDFFVVGCGRSGTSLLHAMLQSHSRIAIPPESHFLPPLLRLERLPISDRKKLRLATKALGVNPRFRAFGVEIPASSRSVFEMVNGIYRSFGQKHGAEVVGDKSPDYVMSLPSIAVAAPETRIIHIVRDPRAVASSLMRVPDWGPNTAAAAAYYWRRRVSAGVEARSVLGNRLLEVTYESLVDEPETSLRKIARFLGIDFEPSMLEYHASGAQLQEMHLGQGHHVRLAEPPKIVETWRDHLSSEQVDEIEKLCAVEMEALGYTRDRPHTTSSASAATLVRHARLSEAQRKLKLVPLFIRSYVR